MFRVIMVLLLAGFTSRKVRLYYLPASFFFTYNPIKIGLGDLGIGLDMMALVAACFAIAQGKSVGRYGKLLKNATLTFYIVYVTINLLNYIVYISSQEAFYDIGRDVPFPISPLIKTIIPGIFIFLGIYYDIRDEKDAHLVLKVFVLSGCMAAVHGIAQYHMYVKKNFFWCPLWARFSVNDPEAVRRNLMLGRAFGPTPHVATYGRSMAILFLVSLWMYNYKKILHPYICLIALGLSSVALFGTASLGAITALLAGSVVLIFSSKGGVDLQSKILFFGYLIFVILFQNIAAPVFEHAGVYQNRLGEIGTIDRFIIWKMYIGETIKGNLLLGGSFMGKGETFDNDVVAVFGTSGIIGIILFFAMLKSLWSTMTKVAYIKGAEAYAVIGKAIVTAILVAAFTGATFFNPKNVEMLFFFLALAAKMGELMSEEKTDKETDVVPEPITMAPRYRRLSAKEAAMGRNR